MVLPGNQGVRSSPVANAEEAMFWRVLTEARRALFLAARLLVILLFAERDRKRGMAAVSVRRGAHFACGLLACGLPWQRLSAQTVLLLVVLLLVGMTLARRLGALRWVEESGQGATGVYLFPLAVVLLYFWSEGRPMLYVLPLLVTAIADPLASWVGGKCGGSRWRFGSGQRTLAGSVAFAVAAGAVGVLYFTRYGWTPEAAFWQLALPLALVAAAAESLSPSGTDNFAVPLTVHFLLRCLGPDR